MRSNVVSLVVGTRGTGKTDFIKNEVVKPSMMPKKLIVDTFDSEVWHNMKTWNNYEGSQQEINFLPPDKMKLWKSGIYRTYSSEPEVIFSMIDSHLKNALLVFEDATKYVGSKLSNEMRRFLYDSKQKNLDLCLAFHSLGSVPPELVRIADTLTLFKTNDGVLSKSKYPFPELETAQKYLKNCNDRFENVTIRLN